MLSIIKMSLLSIVGSLFGGGVLLNKGGKQPRKEYKVRKRILDEEIPSNKHIYHSERYYDTWWNEYNRATKAHMKAQDPINENVLPLFYNVLGSRQELSPEVKSYIEKRGSRLKFFNESRNKKTFINEGGNEMGIQESPMFNPLGGGGAMAGFTSTVQKNATGLDRPNVNHPTNLQESFKSQLTGATPE